MRWREEPPAEPSISSVLNLRDLQEYVSNWKIASLPEYKARNIFRRNWHLFLTLLQSKVVGLPGSRNKTFQSWVSRPSGKLSVCPAAVSINNSGFCQWDKLSGSLPEGAGEGYENTMHAFRRAVDIGTDMLELDCHLSRDGEVVVSHDANLLRCTGMDKNIYDVDYKDLPPLKPRLTVDFDPDVEFVGSAKEEERRFALLREVFEAFPGLPVNIDIKINDDRLIAKVSDLIKEFNREEYTVWGNFNDEITRKCYKANPKVNLLFSMRRVALLIFLTYTGLLPFVPLKESHLEIFLPSIYLRRKGGPTPTFLPLEKLVCQTINVLLMRPSLFNHLRARGIHIYFWVLNKDDEFERAFQLGATGVMTDYPTRLKDFLKNKRVQ